MEPNTNEKNGTKPLEPWLKGIEEIKDVRSLTKFFGKMQSSGSGIVFKPDQRAKRIA